MGGQGRGCQGGRSRGLQEMTAFEPPWHVASRPLSHQSVSTSVGPGGNIRSSQTSPSSGVGPGWCVSLCLGVAVCRGAQSVPGDSCSVFMHLAFFFFFHLSREEKNKGQAKCMAACRALCPSFGISSVLFRWGIQLQRRIACHLGCISVCFFSCSSVIYESRGRAEA